MIKLLTDAVSEVRIECWHSLRDKWKLLQKEIELCDDPDRKKKLKSDADALESDFLLIKNSQRLLITSPYNDTCYWNHHVVEARARKARIYSICPALKIATRALSDFYDITAKAAFSERRSALHNWIHVYKNCDNHFVIRAANSIDRHIVGILNAWKYQKSNSPTESLNRDIKNIKRFSYGAHKFENFRKRVLLSCGADGFEKQPFLTVFQEKADAPGKGGDSNETPST